MRIRVAFAWTCFLVVSTVVAAQTTLDFEGFGDYAPVGTAYDDQGVTFDPSAQKVCWGESNGDPGGWDLEGTNGPNFLCFNGSNPGYAMEMTTTRRWVMVSLDVARSNGSVAGDSFTIQIYRGETQVGTGTIVFGDINSWTTITLSSPSGFDRIVSEGLGSGFHPYGIDNIQLSQAVLDFEGFGDYAPVGNAYDDLGVSFDPSSQKVCWGESNGDPGGWDLEGTNGPNFLCFNGSNPGYVMEMTTTRRWVMVSLDVARSNGSVAGDSFTIQIFKGATQVGTETIVFGNIDNWTTITLSSPSGFDRIVWEGQGSGFHPFGVDNIRLSQPVLDFEGFGDYAAVGTAYDDFGVTFIPSAQKVCWGESNGDPGGWDLEGTNGSNFLCFNGSNPGYVMEMTASRLWTLVYLDVARSAGSSPGDSFTIRTFRGSSENSSKTVVFGNIDEWAPVLLEDHLGFDRITWEGEGAGFHPFGVDNLQLDDHLLIFADGFESSDTAEW